MDLNTQNSTQNSTQQNTGIPAQQPQSTGDDTGLPAVQPSPQSAPVSPVQVPPTIESLQQFTQEQLAQRPVTASAFTQGQAITGQVTSQQPVPVAVPVLVPSEQAKIPEQTGEDPLAKLLQLVRGKEGNVDPIRVKRSFVVVKSKVSNEVIRALVNEFQQDGAAVEDILEYVLRLDQMTEAGEITEEYFLSYLNENEE